MVEQYKAQKKNLKKALTEFEAESEEFKKNMELGSPSDIIVCT